MTRIIHEVSDGADQMSVIQQYAKLPAGGVVVDVRQRTTRAGRAILLKPDQVKQLRDALTRWLDSLPPEVTA